MIILNEKRHLTGRQVQLMRKHRLFHVLCFFAAITVLFGLRLFWIAVVPSTAPIHKGAAAVASVRQRQVHVQLDDGRGTFTDRSGTPLTGFQETGLLLLPGGADELDDARLLAIAGILQANREQLVSAWPRIGERPRWWKAPGRSGDAAALTAGQAASLSSLLQGSAVLAERTVREGKDRVAAQLIGSVSQHPERIRARYADKLAAGMLRLSTPIGASGLELAFDRFLLGHGGKVLSYYTDGKGRPLRGLGLRLTAPGNAYYPLRAVATIDAVLQRSVEELADRYGMREGAAVILEMETADVAALVSRPADQMQNRALSAIPPGSVMKTFLAAVALETKAVSPEETFICNGANPKYGLTCWKEGGHGRLTFKEALAQSCNVVFAEIGERLGGTALQQYAEAMGLSGQIGWSGKSAVDGAPLAQWPEEQPSRLFMVDAAEADGGMLAQTAVGQRDVRLTPLAAANWMVTIFHGGKPASPRAVSELRYADGHALERYEVQRFGSKRMLSPRTVRILREMMEDVVNRGTAQPLADARWPIAGKTGTAEDRQGGRPTVHQWFVGYAPAHQPRYAAAVVFMHRPSGSEHLAVPFFKDLMDLLAESAN